MIIDPREAIAAWRVLDLMTQPIRTCAPDLPLLEAAGLMAAIQAAGVTSLLATLLIWLFPGSPLRERAGEAAETRDIMIMLGAVLAVVLSAVGTGSIFLCLRSGLLSRDQVLGTAAVIAATWALVTFGFAWLALG